MRDALSRFSELNAVPSRSLLGKVAHLAHDTEHRATLFRLASKDGRPAGSCNIVAHSL